MRFDDDVVHAQLIDKAHHLLLGAGGDREHGHHRAHPKDHAEHRQQAAQLVREQARKTHRQFGQISGKRIHGYLPPFAPPPPPPPAGMPGMELAGALFSPFLPLDLALGSASAMGSPGLSPSAITIVDSLRLASFTNR